MEHRFSAERTLSIRPMIFNACYHHMPREGRGGKRVKKVEMSRYSQDQTCLERTRQLIGAVTVHHSLFTTPICSTVLFLIVIIATICFFHLGLEAILGLVELL